MLPLNLPNTRTWLVKIFLIFALAATFIPQVSACDGSSFTIDGLIDNGDGTYTITVTITIAGVDWGGGIWGGTRGFFFNTDQTVLSVTPPSFTSINGTTLPAVIAGTQLSWGNPGSGPFFVAPTDPTQSFTFTMVVGGQPSTWSGGGQEVGNCSYSGTFPCPLPGINILSGDQTICEGNSAVLSIDAPGATQIAWSNGATGTSITEMPTTTTVYTVTATNNCGSVTETLTITVDPLPQMFPDFTQTTICQGQSIDLSVTTTDVQTISWSPIPGNTNTITDIPGITTTYTAVGSNQCGVVSVDITVDVVQFPIAAALNPYTEICVGESVFLEAFVQNEDLIYWAPNQSSSNTALVSPDFSTTYTIAASNFCGTVTDEFVVDVISDPQILFITEDQQVCEGEEVTLEVIASDVDFYLWQPGNHSGNSITVTATNDITYSLVASNNCGTVFETIDIIIEDAPQLSIINGSQTICESDSITLEVDTTNATDVYWMPGNIHSTTLDINPNSDTTYTVFVENDCGQISEEINITIEPPAQSNLELQACEGTTASYQGMDLPIGSVTNFTLTSPAGCDSIVTVSVAQVDVLSSNLQLEACEGTTATYEGQSLAIGSSTDFTFTGTNGCDSIVTVSVAQLDNTSSSLQLEACEGTTATYEGQNLAIGSSTDFTFSGTNGCDSIVTVSVAQLDNTSSSLQLEACEGNTATYEGQSLAIGSSTDFTFTGTNGCDSIVTVSVAQVDVLTSSLQLEACEGNTATYEGQSLAIGSSTDFTFSGTNGCDSIVTVSVAQLDNTSSSLQLEACEGTTATYEGQSLAIGSSTDFTFTGTNGCDSIVTVSVAQVDVLTSSLQLEACQGNTATYEGQSLVIGSSTDFTFTGTNGCDSIVTVSVAQLDNTSSSLQLEACEGNTATYEGQSLAIGSSTDFTFNGTNGCDSIVTVSVAQLDNTSSSLQLEACEGNTATYEGQSLVIGSSTDFTFTGTNGCDSIVTVSVTQLDNTSSSLQLEACEGNTATYEGQSLTIGSSTDFTFSAANGCDSIVTVSVAQLDNTSSSLQLEACEGNTATYEGQSLTIGSSTDFTFTGTNGCDSIVTVSVTQLDNTSSSLQLETCEGTMAIYQGQNLAIGTVTEFTFTAQNGCDSVVSVSVEGVSVYTSVLNMETCAGTMATYNGQNLAIGSSTDFTFMAVNGCDSIVTVSVSGIDNFTSSFSMDACAGSTAFYNGEDLSPGTTTDFTFTSVSGCDSIVTVTVNQLEVYQGSENLQACQGNTASYNGQDLAIGSNTDFTFTATNGCDSVITVEVSGLPVFESDLLLITCTGTMASYNGSSLAVGSVTDFTMSAGNGCDSVVTVTVEGIDVVTNAILLQSCMGNDAIYNGQPLAIGSSTDFTFTASSGCDSVVTITVEGIDQINTPLTLETCEGTTVPYNGTDYPVGYTNDFFYTAVNGCDSVVSLLVTALEVFATPELISVCENTTATYNGQSLDIGTDTDFTFTAANGCDSVVTVSVLGLPVPAMDIELQACEGATASYDGQDLPAGSSQLFTYTTVEGCDSLVTVNVAVLDSYTSAFMLQACQGTQASYLGQDLDIGTITEFTLSAANGCDSIVSVTVIGVDVILESVNLSACEGSMASYNGQDLAIGTSTDFSFVADNGCDSIVTVTVSGLQVFNEDLMLESCEGTTANFNGTALDIGSVTEFSFIARNGCDSIITVSVSGLDVYNTAVALQACEGNSIDYNGISLVAGSDMDFLFTAANGCDSVVSVSVESLETYTSSVELQSCEGSSASYNGQLLAIGSETDFTFSAQNGCDSVVTVEVMGLEVFSSDLLLETCEGTAAIYNGQSLAIGSETNFTFSAQNGCDSMVTVSVAGLEVYEQDLVLETCTGSSAVFDGTDLPAGSITDFTFQSALGCDSVITVFVLDVVPLASSEEEITLCYGDSTAIFGSYVSTAGVYDASFTAVNGCDSTHTIYLDILTPIEIAFQTENACPDENNGQLSASVTGGQAPYQYSWSNGQQGSAELGDVNAGHYQLLITDALGCQQTESFEVEQHSITFSAQLQDVSCFGLTDGEIMVDNAQAGWSYSLDGIIFGNSPIISGLPSGSYSFFIQDEFGCTYQEQLLINQPPPVIVDVIQDTIIELGEDIFLLSNNNWDDLLEYSWTPADFLDCDACPIPTASPLETTTYQVVVTNDKGCTATDQVEIIVKSGNVFIPNVFSPNNNGVNDRFTVFGDQSVAKVHELRVFSRWGELLFEAKNFPPNIPAHGWDGSFRGDQLDPGVFVYYALIEYVDGRQELFKGDITLTR